MDTPGAPVGADAAAVWTEPVRLDRQQTAALRGLLLECEVTQAAVAAALHVDQATVSRYISGGIRWPAGWVATIARLTGLDAETVLARIGVGLVQPVPPPERRNAPVTLPEKTLDINGGTIEATHQQASARDAARLLGSVPQVDLRAYGWGAVGDPATPTEAARPVPLPPISVRRDIAMLAGAGRGYAVQVGDESLSQWNIHRGYYCIVNPDLEPRTGALVACRLRDASGTLRLVIREFVAYPDGTQELVTAGVPMAAPVPASDGVVCGLVVRVQTDFLPQKNASDEDVLASLVQYSQRRDHGSGTRAG